ncbi:hypothetical protein K502DRAFT_319315 [Neoconidiobolus thromboides FSU 785]|nr:hypothetical protein K502DRAFT_319315 [Neoconidiobolus thromboides FSU 785]
MMDKEKDSNNPNEKLIEDQLKIPDNVTIKESPLAIKRIISEEIQRKVSRKGGEQHQVSLIKTLSHNDALKNNKKSLNLIERMKTIDKRKHSLKKDFMRGASRRYNAHAHLNPIKSSSKEDITLTNSYYANNYMNSIKSNFPSLWNIFCYAVTFYAPNFLLAMFGKKDPMMQQAWREKMGLVTIIVLLCLGVGFLTFGLQSVLCSSNELLRIPAKDGLGGSQVVVNGNVYNLSKYIHSANEMFPEGSNLGDYYGKDLSFYFQTTNRHCKSFISLKNPSQPNEYPVTYFPCAVVNNSISKDTNAERVGCHLNVDVNKALKSLKFMGQLYFTWDDIKKSSQRYLIFNGSILDMNRLDYLLSDIQLNSEFEMILNNAKEIRNKDVSYLLANQNLELGLCMEQILKIGVLDTQSIGCISSNIILYMSLIVIIGVVLCKFFMALFFGWVLSRKLGLIHEETKEERHKRLELIENWCNNYHDLMNPVIIDRARFSTTNINNSLNHPPDTNSLKRSSFLPQTSRFSIPLPGEAPGIRSSKSKLFLNSNQASNSRLSISSSSMVNSNNNNSTKVSNYYSTSNTESLEDLSENLNSPLVDIIKSRHRTPLPPPLNFQPYNFALAHTLLLVTCYSEGVKGLRTTFDSLALTDYPSSHKLLYVVCDGIITGAGNEQSTPDICLSMMKDFLIPPEKVKAHSYVALADGKKRHNMAKVYSGYYNYDDTTVIKELQVKVPMILIVKVGTEEERGQSKPGNRGKRDGQIILMAFLQRIMFDERLSELDYEMFNGMWGITGIPPDSYEIVLMVDADTKVYPDSLTKMVAVMVKDVTVMGLCGETKIANKTQSWVTMIQVFEYYISHHLSKAFESIFGGVTCLPGCFCMYRIKAPKGRHGYWVPILANPDIVENYSENVVDTLHKKNLLLLGEDRYLTTLMLRTFPKRKMLFVPQAICKTIVPDEFQVLLSQRRRWINSTVHNLLELVLIRDLCGTFCFSMQFVIFMELVGTVVLPAAITFTLYLIVISFFVKPVPIIPLLLLAAILGLPAVLITFTTRKMVYVGWMLVYLLSLPIWNFVLPVYAYWHFDDFSWGQTRMVQGESSESEDHGKKEGEFDSSHIIMKRWVDFERDKRKLLIKTLCHLRDNNTLYPAKANPLLDDLGYLAPNALHSILHDPQALASIHQQDETLNLS